jgi:hypothetical protein
MHEFRIGRHSPWQKRTSKDFIGSVRRECPDHVIVCTERGLRRVLDVYIG